MIPTAEGVRLTLGALARLFHGDELSSAKLRLVRHTPHSDRVYSEKNSDIPRPERLLSAADKVTALRMNLRLTEIYTAEQATDVFSSGGRLTELLLVFAKSGPQSAEYLGAFRLKGRLTFDEFVTRYRSNLERLHDGSVLIKGLGLARPRPTSVLYDLDARPDILPGMAGRLIVAWPSPRTWIERSLNREILEIRPPGFVKPFTDYLDVTLDWGELVAIVKHAEGNAEWRSKLTAVAGVYLITDTKTWKQYVGSAYGEGGIWKRWEGYAATGHNHNKGLKKLFEDDPAYHRHFRYSLLQVVSRYTQPNEVIGMESAWKERLGSRAIGLNHN